MQCKLMRALRDERGYETLEYALLAAFIVIPLYKMVPVLVDILRSYYGLISFTISLPFP